MGNEIPTSAAGFGAGSRVASYRVEEELGHGGMAVVYLAHDVRLDRRVALKVLAPDLARDQAFRQRFIRESRAAAAVDHPHIIPIFEAGEANGVLFIAMRLVRGGDVQTLIDRHGQLPAARVCHLVSQVSSALDAAHAHGLVHRDVKPANMLLDAAAGGDEPEHVYLSDFGLSKRALGSTELTSAGQFLGTLNYVAPEQIEGRPVDGRTDLYALACSAFSMLGGAPPFKQDDSMAIMWAQLSTAPPPLTARRPDLPAAVDGVLAKALAKAPADRYQTCREFASALRRACGLDRADPARQQPDPPGRPPTQAVRPAELAAAAAPAGTPAAAAPPAAGPVPAAGPAPAADPPPAAGQAAAGAGRAPATNPVPAAAASPAAAGPAPAGPAPAVPAGPPAAGLAGQAATDPVPAAGPGRAAGRPGPGQATGQPPAGAAGGIPASAPGAARPGEATSPSRPAPPPADAAALAAAAGPATQYVRASSSSPVLDRPRGPAGTVLEGYTRGGGTPRSSRRSRALMLVAGVAVIGLAGGYFLVNGTGGTSGGKQHHAAARVVAAPGCTTQMAKAAPIAHTPGQLVTIGGRPFDVATAPGGYAFVSIGSGVMAMRTTSTPPAILWTTQLTHAQGEALTPDRQFLVVSDGSGIDVFRVPDLEQGPAAPVGSLASPGDKHAVEVALTPDGRYAFVTFQNTAHVGVFNLRRALTSGFGPADLVGTIAVGAQPVGVTTSPDGRYAYVTSRVHGAPDTAPGGVVNVIDVGKAEHNPASSVIRSVAAGCQPARVLASPDGQHVWVSAVGANALEVFSAPKLINDPRHALLATAAVGSQPLGLVFVNHGTRIVVADSNRDQPSGGTSSLAVVDPAKVLAGRPGLIGYLPAGVTPRQFSLVPNGRKLLVTDTDSGQLQDISLTHLP